MNQQNTKGSLSGQEVVVLVYSREQAWFESLFSNMACDYDIMVEVNLKFCKSQSGELCQNIFQVCSIYINYVCTIQIVFFLQHSNCIFSSTLR